MICHRASEGCIGGHGKHMLSIFCPLSDEPRSVTGRRVYKRLVSTARALSGLRWRPPEASLDTAAPGRSDPIAPVQLQAGPVVRVVARDVIMLRFSMGGLALPDVCRGRACRFPRPQAPQREESRISEVTIG